MNSGKGEAREGCLIRGLLQEATPGVGSEKGQYFKRRVARGTLLVLGGT